jgi:hypothetical protein
MKTIENKRDDSKPKYIKWKKELQELLNSPEMRKLVREIEEMEYYQRITRNVNVG